MKKMMLLTLLAVMGLAVTDASARYRRRNCGPCVQECSPCKTECAPCETKCNPCEKPACGPCGPKFCLPAAPCPQTTCSSCEAEKPVCVQRFIVERPIQPNKHVSTSVTYSCPVDAGKCEVYPNGTEVQTTLKEITGTGADLCGKDGGMVQGE